MQNFALIFIDSKELGAEDIVVINIINKAITVYNETAKESLEKKYRSLIYIKFLLAMLNIMPLSKLGNKQPISEKLRLGLYQWLVLHPVDIYLEQFAILALDAKRIKLNNIELLKKSEEGMVKIEVQSKLSQDLIPKNFPTILALYKLFSQTSDEVDKFVCYLELMGAIEWEIEKTSIIACQHLIGARETKLPFSVYRSLYDLKHSIIYEFKHPLLEQRAAARAKLLKSEDGLKLLLAFKLLNSMHACELITRKWESPLFENLGIHIELFPVENNIVLKVEAGSEKMIVKFNEFDDSVQQNKATYEAALKNEIKLLLRVGAQAAALLGEGYGFKFIKREHSGGLFSGWKYMELGNLEEYIQTNKKADAIKNPNFLQQTLQVFYRSLKVICDLLALNTEAGDIKPSNFMQTLEKNLLSGEWEEKMIFGDHKVLVPGGNLKSTPLVEERTYGYLAPECWHLKTGQPHNALTREAYAVGVVGYRLFTLTLESELPVVKQYYFDMQQPDLFEHEVFKREEGPQIATVIKGLLLENPQERMSIEKAMQKIAALLPKLAPEETGVCTTTTTGEESKPLHELLLSPPITRHHTTRLSQSVGGGGVAVEAKRRTSDPSPEVHAKDSARRRSDQGLSLYRQTSLPRASSRKSTPPPSVHSTSPRSRSEKQAARRSSQTVESPRTVSLTSVPTHTSTQTQYGVARQHSTGSFLVKSEKHASEAPKRSPRPE